MRIFNLICDNMDCQNSNCTLECNSNHKTSRVVGGVRIWQEEEASQEAGCQAGIWQT